MVIDSSIRVNKLADKKLYLTKGLMQQIKTKIFIQDINNFLSVHNSQKVNCTIYILYFLNKNNNHMFNSFFKTKKKRKRKRRTSKKSLNVQLKGLG